MLVALSKERPSKTTINFRNLNIFKEMNGSIFMGMFAWKFKIKLFVFEKPYWKRQKVYAATKGQTTVET